MQAASGYCLRSIISVQDTVCLNIAVSASKLYKVLTSDILPDHSLPYH